MGLPDAGYRLRQIVGLLINDVAADPTPLLLVLDDCHLIGDWRLGLYYR